MTEMIGSIASSGPPVTIFLFIAVCMLVLAAIILFDTSEWDGAPAVPGGVWYAVVAGLGVWLVILVGL